MIIIKLIPSNPLSWGKILSIGPDAKELFEALINSISNGKITGNPSMAINAKLLLVLEAIAEIMVNKEAKPIAPIRKVMKNNSWFST